MTNICSPRHYISPALVAFSVSGNCHQIPQTVLKNPQLCDIHFLKHFSKGVLDCQEQQAPVFFFTTISLYLDKHTEEPCRPPGQWHTQPAYLPFISFPRRSHRDMWKLRDPFFCFPVFSIAPESCMYRIRLFTYVNC